MHNTVFLFGIKVNPFAALHVADALEKALVCRFVYHPYYKEDYYTSAAAVCVISLCP